MTKIETDPGAVVSLGGRIAGTAGQLDGAAASVRPRCVEAPPLTAAALERSLSAQHQALTVLRTDVMALGRLTEAAGARYAEVEAAAIRQFVAEVIPMGGGQPGG